MGLKVEIEAISVPACGLDIHKDMIEAAVIDEEGNVHQKTFSTMRKALFELRDWILSLNCFHVLMESTSVFWIPIFGILEAVTGMDVGVGNARHMKNAPGRPKTDKVDARWIARICMLGLVLKSFVVGLKFRSLREYTRYHKKLVQDRTRQVNRIEKVLQLNGFKLSSVLSDITGASGMRLLKKFCKTGYVTLDDVIAARDRRCKHSAEEIESAINGRMKTSSRILLDMMIKRLEACDKEISDIYSLMVDASKEYEPQIRILDSIPGIAEQSAIYIIAEISTDMSSFRTSGHIAAWAGLAPKEDKSAGKSKPGKTKKANNYIKTVLIECAWAAVKVKNTRLSNWYNRNVKRLGKKKAITAVARRLLIYIYSMLKSGEMYDDSLDVADTQRIRAIKLESARKIVDSSCASTADGHSNNVDQNVGTAQKARGSTVPESEISEKREEVPPKKRGRPRKVKDDNDVKTAEHNDAPKKRGRPRKVVNDEASATGNQNADSAKKRGRPRKSAKGNS